MKRFLFVILSFFYLISIAQIDAGDDITICELGPVNLSADYTPNSVGTNDYTLEAIPIDTDPYDGTEIINLVDDSYSEIIDIDFNFCFYGNVYDQFLISTNNYLCFDLEEAGGYSTWQTEAIPNGGDVVNSILGPWMDLNPFNGGNLKYQVLGVAPFRRMVVSFEDFGYFNCAGLAYNGQIKLFESTNSIEIHIETMPLCANWNNGESVLGIVNSDETQFLIQPGWNNTQENGNNLAFRFTPTGVIGANVQWFDETGTAVGVGTDVVVNPTETTTYTVVAEECPDNFTDQITVSVSTEIAINEVIDDNICPGEDSGSIEISPIGGTAPLNFSWTSDNGFNSNNEDIFNLGAGNYNLTISDDLGCQTLTGPFNISPPPLPIQVSNQILPVSCFGFNDGQINIVTNGGTEPYTYSWSGDGAITGNGTNSISELITGNYSVIITDNNNCTFNTSFFVNENSSLNINTTTSNYNGFNVRCNNGEDGWISTSVSGGMQPYTYQWADAANNIITTNPDLYNAKSGAYQLTVRDAENCPNVINFNLTEPDSLSLDISNYQHETCSYNNDGFIDIVSWGGPDFPIFSENYLNITYEWTGPNSFYSTQKNISNLSSGNYTVTIEDINNCTNQINFEITENDEVIADYRTIDDTVTINYPIVNLFDNSQGNIVQWYWELSNGYYSNSQDVIGLDLTTNLTEIGRADYDLSLIVIDEFGCTDTTTGIISIKDEHTMYVPDAFTPDLDGWNDVFKINSHAINERSFRIEIYDRLGSIVFSSNDTNFEWNGKHQKSGKELISGVYTFNLSYQDFEGRIYDFTNCKNCMGTVTIIR